MPVKLLPRLFPYETVADQYCHIVHSKGSVVEKQGLVGSPPLRAPG